MNYIKHSAILFCKNNNLERKEITYKKLLHSARQNGYIVKTYSASDELLIYYDLYERAQKSSSTSITDEENIIIFIDDSISKNEQRFALAHEIGHIILEHGPLKKLKKQQEREADLFAHYLITGSAPQKLGFILTLLVSILCICIIIITALLSLPLMREVDFAKQKTEGENISSSVSSQDDNIISANKVIVAPPSVSSSAPAPPSSNYPSSSTSSSSSKSSASDSSDESSQICYYTQYGTVYHIYRDCSYLKNSKTVYTSTIDECEKDRPCSRCADR